MIENIRKYTGLMIVVFVILFISFLLLDTSSVQNVGGGGGYLRIDGKTYTQKEFTRMGQNGYDLLQELIRGGNYELYQFLFAATVDATDEQDTLEKFFISRVLLREAANEFGLQPSEHEISAEIRKMQAFTGQDGEFDASAFGTFIERRIGRLGMTESDVRALISDVMIHNQLKDLLGTGLAPMSEAVVRIDAFENQQVSGALAHYKLAPFEEALDPDEDEVKAFWENLQDAFTTEPLRKFTYIYAKPEFPDETEELPPFTFDDLQLTEEQREVRDQQYRENLAAERAELRRKRQLEIDSTIDDFLYDIEHQQDATFESLATDKGLEVVTTELFSASAAPADLAQPLRQSARGESVVSELFRMITTVDPLSKISPPLAVAEGGWIVARLDEVEPSRVKTYEEAKEEARALYIEEKAIAAMTDAAESAREKILEALAGGQSFAAAAETAGFADVHAFENVTRAYQSNPDREPGALFETVRSVDAGSLAEVLVEGDRAFIAFVEKRELIKDENLAQRIENQLDQATRANETTAYVSWLRSRSEASNIQQLYRR